LTAALLTGLSLAAAAAAPYAGDFPWGDGTAQAPSALDRAG
jgi:hypothetical protein